MVINIIKKKIRRYMFIIAAILLLAITASIVLIVKNSGNSRFQEPELVTYSSPTPDEKKPDEKYPWKGSESSPKKITYEKLAIDGFIQNVGKDQNAQVATPNNIHIAGWYAESAAIGQSGLSIIDGHVDGWTEKGIFTNLKNASVGDIFKITLGDDTIVTYKVFEVTSIEADKAVNYLFSQSPKITSQLNLITCGGQFNKDTNSYEKRIIVYAEKV